MATITVDVPNTLVPDLTQAIALRMQGPLDAAVQAVVTKVLAGLPTTPAEKEGLARAFMKAAAKDALLDYRAQQASVKAREDVSDPAVSW